MREPLAAAYVALSAIFLIWNIVMSGRIAQGRNIPPAFAAIAAGCGLLIAPALLIGIATGSMLYGRAIHTIAWVWPFTVVLFAVQAVQAIGARLVSPILGVPIALYNLMLAVVVVTRWLMSRGIEPPEPALALVAAHASAIASFLGEAAMYSPAALQLPLLAPARRARWRTSAVVRLAMAAVAAGWITLTALEMPLAGRAVGSYAAYERERLQERPQGGLAVGIRIFPILGGGPSPLAVRNDLAVADSIGADALHLILTPAATDRAALDSIRRTLEERRQAGTRLLVSLGYERPLLARFRDRPPFDGTARLEAIDRIVRRLRPDIVFPAHEPYGAGLAAHGVLPVADWRRFLTEASRRAKSASGSVRVGVSLAAYGPRDSALYTWAAAPRSPVDVIGLVFSPSRYGARALDAQMQTTARWMAIAEPEKPHWVFAAAGFPTTHGERSQELAVHGAMAWATRQAAVQGIVFVGASDYDRAIGLRAPNGRLRRAATEVARSVRALRERSADPTASARIAQPE